VNLFELIGWKAEFACKIPDKCIVCIAPHTSNWDFIIGILFKKAYKINANFFIKKEWMRFPTKTLISKLGGLPINRDKRQSTTEIIAAEFAKRKNLIIGITPEGTRKYNREWKMGFYHIAQKANVPIIPLYIDYKTKTIGIGKEILPTDIKKVLTEISDFYKNITAKIPKNFGLPENCI
jgi:1-acyl-sn-glycerol-3-phosphate acyltransferase